jgi:hypothetical protein
MYICIHVYIVCRYIYIYMYMYMYIYMYVCQPAWEEVRVEVRVGLA